MYLLLLGVIIIYLLHYLQCNIQLLSNFQIYITRLQTVSGHRHRLQHILSARGVVSEGPIICKHFGKASKCSM